MTSEQKKKNGNAANSSRRNFIKGTAMATSALALQSWGFPWLKESNSELINRANEDARPLASFDHTTTGTAQLRTIEVDAAAVTGRIRSLQGLNNGPAQGKPDTPNLIPQYRELGIDTVRTHDSGADINAWIPTIRGEKESIFPKWDADPFLPQSYDFSVADRVVNAIAEAGAEPYFRLGSNHDPRPPADFDKYAEICKHVVMHFNGGWANGYHYNIRYWEFWNEPNLTMDWVPLKEQNRPDWSGTPEQFFDLYRKVVLALIAYDPNLKVGSGSIAEGGRRSAYREQFMQYCAKESIPLDFFSWHHYHENSSDPYDMIRIAKDIRLLLNSYGLRNTESHAGEWNLSIRDEPPQSQASAAAAAFTATALMYMQDAPVDLSHYYSGRAGDMGPFEPDGRFRKKAYVFKAMREMLTAPQRVSATGGDTLGFAVLAGRSRDCSRVNILISNYQMGPVLSPAQSVPPGIPGVETGMPRANQILYENNKGYDLRVSNLPWGKQPFSVRRYRIGEKENFNETLVPSNGSGTFSLQLEMNAPGVDLIILEAKQSG